STVGREAEVPRKVSESDIWESYRRPAGEAMYPPRAQRLV
ncbi:MAG: hypothetical protein RL625_552, partial [Gemmatimonadota bacterium]